MKKILSILLAAIMLISVMAVGVSAATFADTTNHWGKEYIDYWTGEDAVSGYQDGTFRPNNKVTRGEVAQIVTNILNLVSSSKSSPFSDMKSGAWYYEPVLACYDSGIIIGFPDKTVRATQPITREQAILIISRITNLSPDAAAAGHFTDGKNASSWAAGAIGALFNAGVLDGYPNASGSEIRPKAEITRAEFLKLFAIVDKSDSIGYRVGSRQRSTTTDQGDQSVVIPAIASSTASTTYYYVATVEIHDKNNADKFIAPMQISATNETGSTPILADVYKYVVAMRSQFKEVFNDEAARNEMDAIIAKYLAKNNKLEVADLADYAIDYTGDTLNRGFSYFLGAAYKNLGFGTYVFEHTVGEIDYVVTLTIEKK